MTDFEKAALQH